MSRHRQQEFIRFLNKINRRTPPDLDLHPIVVNYATHKRPKVRALNRSLDFSIGTGEHGNYPRP